MGTTARIGYHDAAGFHSIYCGHDGYIENPGLGWALKTYWNTLKQAENLVSLGNTSGIDKDKSECYDEDDNGGLASVTHSEKWIDDCEYGYCFDTSDLTWKLWSNNNHKWVKYFIEPIKCPHCDESLSCEQVDDMIIKYKGNI